MRSLEARYVFHRDAIQQTTAAVQLRQDQGTDYIVPRIKVKKSSDPTDVANLRERQSCVM